MEKFNDDFERIKPEEPESPEEPEEK